MWWAIGLGVLWFLGKLGQAGGWDGILAVVCVLGVHFIMYLIISNARR